MLEFLETCFKNIFSKCDSKVLCICVFPDGQDSICFYYCITRAIFGIQYSKCMNQNNYTN